MRILFATDGSDSNLAAATFLSRLGHHLNVHVHLVIATEGDKPDDDAFALRRAQELIGDFAGHFTHSVFRADSTSEIVDKILCASDVVEADLIVVGARGQSAIARFLLGSVAEAVARHARVPVLVSRLPETSSSDTDSPPQLTEVIVGVDGSNGATNAAMFAATSLPLPTGSILRLVTVLPQPQWIVHPEMPTAESMANHDTNNDNTHHAEEVLSNLRQELETVGAKVTTETVYGDPATELINLAMAYHTGLIVVGSRGLSGVERLFIGSVSDRLLWNAPCSVLVCRTSLSEDIEGEIIL